MKCICILKTNHECSETLDSYEKQCKENDNQLSIIPNSGFELNPIQLKFKSNINGVKLLLPMLDKLHEGQIAHFSTIVSHFPQEFSKIEKEIMHKATTNMMAKSKKYFCKDGRMKERLL